jgi:hypothetical protein
MSLEFFGFVSLVWSLVFFKSDNLGIARNLGGRALAFGWLW